MSALTYFTTSVDVNDYINPDGTMKSYAGTTIDNPRYLAEASTLKDNVDRLIGYTGVNIKITDWLTADYQVGVDFYGDGRTRIAPNGLDISTSTGGFIVEEKKHLPRNKFQPAHNRHTFIQRRSQGQLHGW